MFTKNLILKNWAWLPRDYRGFFFFFVHGPSFNYTLRNLTPHFELVILSTNLTSDTTFQVPAEVFLCKWIMCQLEWLSAMPRFDIPHAEIDAVHPSNCLTIVVAVNSVHRCMYRDGKNLHTSCTAITHALPKLSLYRDGQSSPQPLSHTQSRLYSWKF